MQIPRRYTAEGRDPFAAFAFVSRTSRIVNPDGSVVFEMKDLRAPEHWSQVAVDILAQKYFRKAGIAAKLERVPEAGVAGQLVAVTIAAWNPYVAERLLQGHWSLVVGYGCLPWVATTMVRLRTSDVAPWYEVCALVFWIGTTNLYNRLNVTTRQPAGKSWD